MRPRNPLFIYTASLLALLLFTGSAFGFPFLRKKKYEAPISKETLQPDKVLFDRAIHNIEKGNYEVARLTLNTLINTYDTSEFLAKAKLAIADSWYREGGAHGLAQAEAEYKDFILFYPNMEEAGQSQYKVCEIHFKQMEKSDRDSAQATRAEDECRQVMIQFPNGPYTKQAEQKVREVQEVIADKEFRTGDFYQRKGSFPAAASRFTFVTSQYPLYSGSDQALWELAEDYKRMGDRFENQEADALTRIVKDYPLSAHVDGAKERLTALKRAIPQADAAAYAHQKYELENRKRQGMVSKATGLITGHPDTSFAAKSGAPAMTALRPTVPVSVPQIAAGSGSVTGVSDVVGGVVGNTENLDKGPDARMSAQNGVVAPAQNGTGEQKASVGSNGQAATPQTPATLESTAKAMAQVAPPTNHPVTAQQMKEALKAQQKAQAKAAKLAKKTTKPADAKGETKGLTTAPTNGTVPATASTPGTNPAANPGTTPVSPVTPHPPALQ